MRQSGRSKPKRSAAYIRFLQALRKTREAAGLTQVQAARRLHRPQSFVSKCESGERRVDVVELIIFCRIYRAKVAGFITSIAGDEG